jgi:hypothetical protein
MLLNGKLPRRAPPPKSSLGAWLLKQAYDVRAAISALTNNAAVDGEEIEKLRVLVDQLLAEAERSAKVQAAQGVELEQVRRVTEETQRQLNGVKISRGLHKAKAQKLLQDMQHRLN